MEIFRGVHHIKLPLKRGALDHVNVYLIEGKKGNLLIDTGWNTPESFSTLKDELKAQGFEFKDISQIVITHSHSDHYGTAGRIKDLSGAKIAMSDIEAGLLHLRYEDMAVLIDQVSLFLRANGAPESELAQLSEASLPVREFVVPAMPDIKLKAGRRISMEPFEFKVLFTPGHSPGHICLYEPNRKYLFAGDHVLPDISPNVGLHPQSGENPLGDFISSLKALLKLEINFVFPGHGPVFSGLGQRVSQLLHHHEQRIAAILEAMDSEASSVYQIATQVPWNTDVEPTSFKKLPALDRRLAMLETLAHLQLLVSQGRVKKITKGDSFFYQVEDTGKR